MDWVLQHLWVLLVIAGLAVRVLQATKGKGGGEGAPPAPPKEFEFGDPELAERTRRIREEIRRKIEERRGRPAGVPPAGDRPRLDPAERSAEATPPPLTLPEIIREVMQPEPAPEPPPVSAPVAAAEAERQAALAAQLRAVVEMKQASERRDAFEAATTDPEPAALRRARADVLDDLRDPAALRRAFVLREILGPPVALRR